MKKKFYLREAVDLYTKGLDMGATLPELLSILHSNRAHAHSVLGNWRNTLQDSQKAVQLNPANLKVCTIFSCDSACSVLVICCAAAKMQPLLHRTALMLAQTTARQRALQLNPA